MPPETQAHKEGMISYIHAFIFSNFLHEEAASLLLLPTAINRARHRRTRVLRLHSRYHTPENRESPTLHIIFRNFALRSLSHSLPPPPPCNCLSFSPSRSLSLSHVKSIRRSLVRDSCSAPLLAPPIAPAMILFFLFWRSTIRSSMVPVVTKRTMRTSLV